MGEGQLTPILSGCHISMTTNVVKRKKGGNYFSFYFFISGIFANTKFRLHNKETN